MGFLRANYLENVVAVIFFSMEKHTVFSLSLPVFPIKCSLTQKPTLFLLTVLLSLYLFFTVL